MEKKVIKELILINRQVFPIHYFFLGIEIKDNEESKKIIKIVTCKQEIGSMEEIKDNPDIIKGLLSENATTKLECTTDFDDFKIISLDHAGSYFFTNIDSTLILILESEFGNPFSVITN